MNKPNSNISLACGSVVLAATMAIAGCNERDGEGPTPEVPVCPDPCPIDIGLPGPPDQLPQPPDKIVVDAGSEVNFKLPQGDPQTDDERTVLSFEERALVDEYGNAVFTVELTGGDNVYKAGEKVCRPPKGCRYVVINVGQPDRPSVISSPHFVIR